MELEGLGAKEVKTKKLNLPSTRELGLVVFIILASIFIQTQNPNFLTVNNMLNMLRNTSILAILGVGMMMVIITGGIDLSVGAVVALSGMSAAVFVRDFPHLPTALSVLLALAVGTICGLILGMLVSKAKILPIIASLGLMNVFRGFTFIVGDNAWVSAFQMSDTFKSLATGTFLYVSNIVWIAAILLAVFWYFLNYTRTGRHIYAVGSNADATSVTGINKNRILLTVYGLNGFLAGLAGVLWVSMFASAQGDTAQGFELNVIAACVLGGISVSGGVGKISGLITGTLLFGILNNALPLLHVSTFWENVVRGLVILIAIVMNILMKRNADQKVLKERVI